jgi:hypothetical protein
MILQYEFKLPDTKMCLVVWYRNGKRHEQLINTPQTCKGLQQIMFARYQVGYSEIRAIESVDPTQLLRNFGTNWGRA